MINRIYSQRGFVYPSFEAHWRSPPEEARLSSLQILGKVSLAVNKYPNNKIKHFFNNFLIIGIDYMRKVIVWSFITVSHSANKVQTVIKKRIETRTEDWGQSV